MSTRVINWAVLPFDLLTKIAGTLDDIPDRIRFGLVCKSWLSAFKSTHLPRVRLPWILLKDPKFYPWFHADDVNDEVQSFLSLSHNKIYSLRLPNTSRMRYFGSAYGLLPVVDDSGRRPMVSLLNPITKAWIFLPPLTAEIKRCKLVETPEFVVTMVVTQRLLIPCRQRKGEDIQYAEWTRIRVVDTKGTVPGIVDFTYYKGHYFVVGEWGRSTIIFDPDTSQPVSMIPYVGMDREFHQDTKYRQYLAESSSGEKLFLVISHSEKGEEKFEVFELDQTDGWTWTKVRNIGGNVLFVDDHRAMVLPASDFFGCRGNCIVFFDYHPQRESPSQFYSNVAQFNLFDIGSNMVQRIPSAWNESMNGWANFGWFVPSL